MQIARSSASRMVALASLSVLVSCGYHVGMRADTVPKSIQTISVPPFNTTNTRYKLADSLPQAIGRELMARTRFRIEADPTVADAVLNGKLLNLGAYPTVYDPGTGRATSVRMYATLSVELVERATGRVLYSKPNFAVSAEYEEAVDPHQYFDESDPALQRLSQDVAHDIVAAIGENF